MTALGGDRYESPAVSPNGTGPSPDSLLEVKDAYVEFRRGRRSPVRAVDGVSFTIRRGETLGLVGESGCGKTTLTRALLGLTPLSSGQVLLNGIDIGRLTRRKMRPYRPQIQVVFQDPNSALNPRMTVRQLIGEPLQINRRYSRNRIDELLEAVGLSPDMADRHASSFSGGQRQRIGIARALALDPALLILDEPVSALDVSIQAQVINLLKRLQQELLLTYLFIAHDLAVVRHMADHVAVMYLGKVVEYGTRDQIFHAPQHPYTQSLLAAVPVPDPARREEARSRTIIGGDLPDPANPPSGCHFRTRCPRAQQRCASDTPAPDERISAPGHLCACFFPGPPT
jgi:oligopeptide/dipeptide ABC transporter ATP-binding protein